MTARYQLKSLLGKGSSGGAWLAYDTTANEYVTVKEILLGPLRECDRERAYRECELLAVARHPNIVGYRDHFIQNGTLYLVIQYADLGDLRKYTAARKPLSDTLIIHICREVLRGLKYLHARRIIHRDIKPANILLQTGNNLPHILLGDFGVARILDGKEYAETIIGTPYYLAPEVVLHEPYSEKCDIWALGVVIYELITGTVPFKGRTLLDVARRITSGEVPPLPSPTSALANVVREMLQCNPERRPSASQLLLREVFIDEMPRVHVKPRAAHEAEFIIRLRQLHAQAARAAGPNTLRQALAEIVPRIGPIPSAPQISQLVAERFDEMTAAYQAVRTFLLGYVQYKILEETV